METKDFVFFFPVITAIVLFISLIFPIMLVSIYIPVLIDPAISGELSTFGVGIMDILAPYILIESDLSEIQMGLLFVRVIFMAFFILGGLLLIISGIRVKIGRLEVKKARKKWLRNGIFYIIGDLVILLFLWYFIPYSMLQFGIGVELNVTMGIGMILTILAGGILILAYIIAKIKE
ncbi:MAG: hypothetical protein ACFFEY_02435 [Candidatus Thorarchaeota archaeon]